MPEQSLSRKSHFSRDVLTLVTGTTISQIITILASPVITRLYGPEAFGLLALFNSITAILVVIVCLTYENAIMLPKSDEDAANLLGLCILITLAVTILLIIALFLSGPFLEMILKSSQIGYFFWLIPISIFLSGVFQALTYWNTRTKQFHRLAIAQVIRSGSSTGAQIGFGFAGFASGGILIGVSVFGQIISTFTLGIQIMRDHLSFFRKYITIKGIIVVLKRYSDFPKFYTGAAFLNTFTNMLPVFILTAYFGPTIAGYYALGFMVLTMPAYFIKNAIAQVFFQKAVEDKNISHESIKDTVGQTIKPLIFISFLSTLLFILIGPELFSVIFGPQWAEAGNYVRFLSIWIGITFISSPISTLFSVFEKQRFTLFFNIYQLISQGGALIIGATTGNALFTISLFAIVSFFNNLIAYKYLLGLAGISIQTPKRIITNYLMFSVPFILFILIFQYVFPTNNLLIVVVSLFVYAWLPLILLKRDSELSDLLKNMTASIPVINKISKFL